MKVLIQRVNHAQVRVGEEVVGKIENGLLVFLGIGKDDTEDAVDYLVEKIVNLRIFSNDTGKFDLSLLDAKGEVLVVSQFTLYGNCDKGRRPDFFESADPVRATQLYKSFVHRLKEKNIETQTGEFGAYMKVELENDGPVTFMLESK